MLAPISAYPRLLRQRPNKVPKVSRTTRSPDVKMSCTPSLMSMTLHVTIAPLLGQRYSCHNNWGVRPIGYKLTRYSQYDRKFSKSHPQEYFLGSLIQQKRAKQERSGAMPRPPLDSTLTKRRNHFNPVWHFANFRGREL
jgi:hypothetical protein